MFQRGYDCIYPLVHLFGIPEQLDIQMIFTENGMDAAGTVKGTLGSAQVEIVYSKISGSHCRARELDRSMAFIKGNCDWRLQLASSLQALQMMDEIRGGKKTKDLICS